MMHFQKNGRQTKKKGSGAYTTSMTDCEEDGCGTHWVGLGRPLYVQHSSTRHVMLPQGQNVRYSMRVDIVDQHESIAVRLSEFCDEWKKDTDADIIAAVTDFRRTVPR
jgi:hypothetical protein